MIKIVELNEFLPPTEKKLIPPQLSGWWAKIIDSVVRKGYVICVCDADVIKEHLNFYIMKCSFGNFLISMPYIAYGSCFDVANKKYLSKLFSELEKFALENDCLAMSICTHPFASLPFDVYHDVFNYSFYYKNFCQISELDVHPLLKLTHKRRMAFRNEISKIEKDSDYFIDTNPDEDTFNKWVEVYNRRFQELGGIPLPKWFYLNYYKESQTNDKNDFWVLRNDSVVLGGIFCSTGENIVDYGTSAFRSDYRKLYPTTFLLNSYFEKLIKEGIRYFNWQSSPSKGGGVYNYKMRWGAKEYEHYYFSKNLVDISEIIAIPLSKIKSELAGCYVLPYTLWDEEVKK
ncbi:hypothetical protein C5S31_04295 [ANME-1 cluster archaeon GoMg2]|nr:hypothetical protein [ANME-1 cluster archaeon GoMg2]